MENKRLLVVDDTVANLQLLGNILKNKYSLSFATSGQEALEILTKSIPDLILLDVMMPKMDGYEVCRQIRTTPDSKHVPIMFLTAKADRDSVVKGMKAGAQDYLVKPFSAEDVLSRIAYRLSDVPQETGNQEGRLLEKTDKIFLDNRLKNFSVCQDIYKTDFTAEIGHIESQLNPLVSVIPHLLGYIRDVEELMFSDKLKKEKELLSEMDSIQEKRLNPEVTASVHTLHDNLQDIQFSLLDFISNHAPTDEEREKTSFSARTFITGLSAFVPQNVAIKWAVKEEINLQGNEKILRQVILSLIDNALDANSQSSDTPACTVRMDQEKSGFVLSVVDPGPGIRKDLLEKVFDSGFSTKSERNGFGLTASKYLLNKYFKCSFKILPGSPCIVQIIF